MAQEEGLFLEATLLCGLCDGKICARAQSILEKRAPQFKGSKEVEEVGIGARSG